MQQTFELFLGILAIFAFLMMIGGVIGYVIMAIVAGRETRRERDDRREPTLYNEDDWEDISQ